MKNIKTAVAYLVISLSVTSCSSYLEAEIDNLIAHELNDDVTFMASFIDVQCTVENADYHTSTGVNQFVEHVDRATKNIESFDESSERVKFDLIALVDAIKKVAPLMQEAERIQNDNGSGILETAVNVVSAVGIGAQAEEIKKEAESAKSRLQDSTDEYVRASRKRSKKAALTLKDSAAVQLSALFSDKDETMDYMVSSLKKSMHNEYKAQSLEYKESCFDKFASQIDKPATDDD